MWKPALALFFLLVSPVLAHAQFAVETTDQNGVLNPIDFSYRYYLDEMNRFPDRIGLICGSAYELDKTGDHSDAVGFFTECAKRGSPQSMLSLANIYENGVMAPADLDRSAFWVKQAADMGWAPGEYYYGLALIRGRGVKIDRVAGEAWLRRAAAHGDKDAAAYLAGGGDKAATE